MKIKTNEITIGRLGFNKEQRRYGVLVDDLWEIEGLNCGRNLEWYNADKCEWVIDRLEGIYPANTLYRWYFAISNIKGQDLEGLRVRM